MKNKKSFFSEQLKKIMSEQDITQKDLAKKLGVVQQMISFWTTGNHSPNLNSIEKVAKALNVPASYFIETPESDKNTVNGLDEKDIKILQLEKENFRLEKEVMRLEKENLELNLKLKKKEK